MLPACFDVSHCSARKTRKSVSVADINTQHVHQSHVRVIVADSGRDRRYPTLTMTYACAFGYHSASAAVYRLNHKQLDVNELLVRDVPRNVYAH